MPARRLTVWFGLGLVVLMGIAVGMTAALQSSGAQERIGGRFAMSEINGRRVSEQDLLGRPTAVFFGFTSCPDACPTTLLALTDAMRRMGRDANRLNVVFVTLDPARDTPDEMRLYLSNFDSRIRGFTGTDDEVARMAAAYHVAYRRVPLPDGSYTLDHFAGVLLFDASGRYAGMLPYGADEAQIFRRLDALATSRACAPSTGGTGATPSCAAG